jgi:hypothetical protein
MRDESHSSGFPQCFSFIERVHMSVNTTERPKFPVTKSVAKFNREFFDAQEEMTYIGAGEFGGKATGLAFIHDTLAGSIDAAEFPDVTVSIPRLTVLTTEVFDTFMERNELWETALSDLHDDRIAHAFQKAEFPTEYIGDLMALIAKVHQPLAVRSSSLLEDAMYHPFAGVYATKMIPNNQPDVETRFRKLVEAVKFVWASTFFGEAKAYIARVGQKIENEKMAVIIQEVVGSRFGERFYPHFSGVARSFNFYPMGRAKPEDGVVDLALGLGKTIVDGGLCWTYSPSFPKAAPPYASARDLVDHTQNLFWSVNMGKPPAYDPIHETEYLIQPSLSNAEEDGTLTHLASTYDVGSDRLVPGMHVAGPRVLNFSPLLNYNVIPLNNLLKKLLKACETTVGAPVEIEFAVTLGMERALPARLGFLQVRPMVVSNETVEVGEEMMHGAKVAAASNKVLGNGVVEDVSDVVYVRPETFEARHTPQILNEIAEINQRLTAEHRPYLLIGFGRWGSSDPWLGIPVVWSQISGARVIVEATLPDMNVDLSQGSHFFHNLTSFQVCYFAVRHDGPYHIDWDWLNAQEKVFETEHVRHVRAASPLRIAVDGRSGRGVITHD